MGYIIKIIGRLIYFTFGLFIITYLILILIGVSYFALFDKIPTFQSLQFVEFKEYYNQYRGTDCYSVSKGRGGGTAYKFKLRHNEGIYESLYTIPTQEECYKQLDELEHKYIRIWYNVKDTGSIFNRKESYTAIFEIYQLEANDRMIISYQEMFNKKKAEQTVSRLMMFVMYALPICIYWQKKKKERVEANNDFRRYGL